MFLECLGLFAKVFTRLWVFIYNSIGKHDDPENM